MTTATTETHGAIVHMERERQIEHLRRIEDDVAHVRLALMHSPDAVDGERLCLASILLDKVYTELATKEA